MSWLPSLTVGLALLLAPDMGRGVSPDTVFFVDPDSNSARQAALLRAAGKDADAELLHAVAESPQADWFGGWSGPIGPAVTQRLEQIDAVQSGGLAVFVAYNVPGRDCSGYSAGGANTADEYRAWIDGFAGAFGARRAVVILEPDSLALTECLAPERRAERYALIEYAVGRLVQQPGVAVYLDGGHSAWQPAAEQATRLSRAGVATAQGFFLNVSNFQLTEREVGYGLAVSALTNGAHFVIDTSRNGSGPWESSEPETWCNPPGRALGPVPTVDTGNPVLDALLWIKRPGESDGACRGAPIAGAYWADYALQLARNRP